MDLCWPSNALTTALRLRIHIVVFFKKLVCMKKNPYFVGSHSYRMLLWTRCNSLGISRFDCSNSSLICWLFQFYYARFANNLAAQVTLYRQVQVGRKFCCSDAVILIISFGFLFFFFFFCLFELTGVEFATACSCFPLFQGKCSCHMQTWVSLYSLDNLLQKNVIVFFFENEISKWRSFEKGDIFDLLFTFFIYQRKVTKIPSAHISLADVHVFCSPYWLFCLTNFEKNTNL